MPIIFCDYHEYNPLRYSFANTDIASIKWLRVYSGLVGRIIYNLYSLATSIWLASSYCLDDFCIMYDACTRHFTLLQMWHDDLIEFWFFNIIKTCSIIMSFTRQKIGFDSLHENLTINISIKGLSNLWPKAYTEYGRVFKKDLRKLSSLDACIQCT